MSAVFGKSAELVVSGEPDELDEPADAEPGEPAGPDEPDEPAETVVFDDQPELPAWCVLLFSSPSVSDPPPCCP